MQKHYKFRTSLGYVFISFDPDAINSGMYKITMDSGEEYLQQLFQGDVADVIGLDNCFWVLISNGGYGYPEYLLEEVFN